MPGPDPRPRAASNLSLVVLLLANAVPLFGVGFLGWQVLPLLLVYWCENVIVGAFNVLAMLTLAPRARAPWPRRLSIALLFVLHYGFFALVHLAILFWVFASPAERSSGLPDLDAVIGIIRANDLHWAVLGLLVSHAFVFAVDHLSGGERYVATLTELMQQPYRRVLVLHLALILGGALIDLIGAISAGLFVLVALKIAFELHAHARERAELVPGD